MNTENKNTGGWNVGDRNTGNRNVGNWNVGDRNTGSWNTGNWNTGNWNTGNWNTGDRNTGSWNTGTLNNGRWNTGCSNACDCSSGFFNTVEQKVPVFNGAAWVNRADFIESSAYTALFSEVVKLTEWIDEEKCTDYERGLDNYIAGTGVLVSRTFKEACSLWWEKLTSENKALIQTMEGFNPEIFKEITGIDVVEKKTELQVLKQEMQALIERISKLESETTND